MKKPNETQFLVLDHQDEMIRAVRQMLNQLCNDHNLHTPQGTYTLLNSIRNMIIKVKEERLEPLIEDFIKMGCPALFKLLLQQYYGNYEILHELTWILVSIFAGCSKQHLMLILQHGYLPLYKGLLQVEEPSILENVIWGLGNMVDDNRPVVDAVQSAGIEELINSQTEVVFRKFEQTQEKAKFLDVFRAYVFYHRNAYKHCKDPFLGNRKKVSEFMFEVTFNDFKKQWRDYYSEDFLDFLKDTVLSVEKREIGRLLNENPNTDALIRSLFEITVSKTCYEDKESDLWDIASRLLDNLLHALDADFAMKLLQNDVMEPIMRLLQQESKSMAAYGLTLLSGFFNKQLLFNDPNMEARFFGKTDLYPVIVSLVQRLNEDSRLSFKENLLDALIVLLEANMTEFNKFCLQNAYSFEPIFNLLSTNECSVGLEIKILEFTRLFIKIEDFEEDQKGSPCRDMVIQQTDTLMDFINYEHKNYEVSKLCFAIKDIFLS